MKRLLAVAALLILLIPALTGFAKERPLALVVDAELVAETNKNRAAEKLTALKINPLLRQAAQLKARDMAEKGYFDHIGPDGKSFVGWLNEVGYLFRSAGENLAINFQDSKEVVSVWSNSPTHRTNILNKKFTEVGAAAADGYYRGQPAAFVVQFFGQPMRPALASAVTVVNKTGKFLRGLFSQKSTAIRSWMNAKIGKGVGETGVSP